MQGKYGIFIRNRNGEIIYRVSDFSSLRILATLNDVGSWQMSSRTITPCPFEPGMGIIVVRNSDFLYGGIVERIQDKLDAKTKLYSWSVSGVGDLGYLARRICYVDPVTGLTTTKNYYTDSDRLSTVVKNLIEKNVGVNALEERKEPSIIMKNTEPFGNRVSVSLRFQNLLKAIVSLCRVNGYNIRPLWDISESKIYFELYIGKNLTQEIVFTEYLNNITESEFLASTPEANFVLAGGKGELKNRQFSQAQNDLSIDQWGRIEVFQDARSQDNIPVYAKETLYKKSENTIGYSCVASDTENAPQYGVDYGLGDLISMKVGKTYIAAEVQQVEINVSGGRESISPKFGTVAIGKFREIFRDITNIREELDELLGKEVE